MISRVRIALLLLILVPVVVSDVAAAAGDEEQQTHAEGILSLLPPPVRSAHSIATAGESLAYEAEAGTISLLGGEGEVTAKVFYVAYTAKPAAAALRFNPRPVTFVFNGGPGAAAAYLHLGALGPRIIETTPAGEFVGPPQRLKDNPDTWLDMTDLVFVDPVETGYSRAAPGVDTKRFFGVDEDASSMGAFVRLYLQKANRTNSPIFLAGESYGGFRAALLARTLQEDVGIAPSGIILISPALEFSMLYADDFEPLHWGFGLTAMAAVRLERNGVHGDDLRRQLADVEHYALSDYIVALASGLEAGRDAASDDVIRLTGLPADLVRRYFARVPLSVFAREFDRARGRVLSRYDGTVETADIAPDSEQSATPDPLLDRSVPVLTPAFVDYVRNELGYRTDISYRLLNGGVNRDWDYGTSQSRQGYAGVLDDIEKARSLNPHLKVLIVHGYTDLITPYLTSQYLVRQLPTLPGVAPVKLRVYEGGHMMYLRADSRRLLKQDAAEVLKHDE